MVIDLSYGKFYETLTAIYTRFIQTVQTDMDTKIIISKTR